MNADVLVSVVIPCYNYGQYLAEALESALNQTHSPIEVIVVDDGSTDSTPDVCREYANRITVVRQQNGGLPSSRNRGIQVATGTFIAFLDADDILEPTYLERTLRAFHENSDLSIGFVYTQMTLFGREQGITTFPEFDRETFVFENYAHATSLIRASLFENVKYDDRFQTGWEDWDVYLGFIELGYHGKLVDAPLLRYRKHVDLKSQTDGLKDDIKINQLRIAVMANHRRLYRTWEYRCHQVRTKVLLLKLTLTHRYASRWPSFHQ